MIKTCKETTYWNEQICWAKDRRTFYRIDLKPTKIDKSHTFHDWGYNIGPYELGWWND